MARKKSTLQGCKLQVHVSSHLYQTEFKVCVYVVSPDSLNHWYWRCGWVGAWCIWVSAEWVVFLMQFFASTFHKLNSIKNNSNNTNNNENIFRAMDKKVIYIFAKQNICKNKITTKSCNQIKQFKWRWCMHQLTHNSINFNGLWLEQPWKCIRRIQNMYGKFCYIFCLEICNFFESNFGWRKFNEKCMQIDLNEFSKMRSKNISCWINIVDRRIFSKKCHFIY